MTKQVTCTEDGTLTRSCNNCEYSESIPVTKTGHDFTGPYVQSHTHHYHLCKNGCGTTMDYAEHTYKNGSNICDICGYERILPEPVIPQIHEHQYTDWRVISPATCTTDGTMTRSCNTCEDVETATITHFGHDFSGKYITTPTHHFHQCLNGCGEIDNKEEHVYEQGSTQCKICHYDKGSTDLLSFELNHDGNGVTVTGFNGNGIQTNLVIPDTYYGYPVTRVAAFAFSKAVTNQSLTSVTLGKYIVDIEQEAFWGNDKLTKIVLPAVQHIGKWAFESCKTLGEVTFNEGIESIAYGAFMNCRLQADITFPQSLKSVGDWAFQSCLGIQQVTFQNVEHIGIGIFYGCSNIHTIHLGDGNLVLDDYALQTCTGLKNVTIGNNVVSVGTDIFYGDSQVIYKVEDNVKYIGNTNNPYVIAISNNDSNRQSLALKSGTRIVANNAFSYCSNLNSVTFNTELRRIGVNAFRGCNNIGTLQFNDSLEKIDKMAFCDCSNLATVEFGSGIKEIGSDAFDSDSKITTVNVPSIEVWLNITFHTDNLLAQIRDSIDCNPLANGSAILQVNGETIKDVSIPDGIQKISSMAFAGYGLLESVSIPNSVEEIGFMAFYKTPKLNSITVSSNNQNYLAQDGSLIRKEDDTLLASATGSIPDGVKKIDHYALSYKTYNKLILPESLEDIGVFAFESTKIDDITINVGLKKIQEYAFDTSGLYNHRIIRIPDIGKWCNVDILGASQNLISVSDTVLFAGNNYSNSTVTIPDTVTEIKSLTFSGMTMYYMSIPKETIKIASTAFLDSQHIEKCLVAAENPIYKNEADGHLLIEKATSTVIFGGRGYDYQLSELDIAAIGNYAFHSRSIQGITLGDSVKKIGEKAFYSCSTSTMILGNSIEEIGSEAFGNNKNITSITLPSTLQKMGSSIFLGCTTLQSVYVQDPNNWKYLTSDGETYSPVDANLSDPSTAANYLKFHSQLIKQA